MKPSRVLALAAEPAPLLDDLLPYLMNRLVSRLNRNLDTRLRRRRLTFQHWRVLAVLNAHDRSTVSALAELAVIPQATLSRLLDRMGERGFVRRSMSRRDSRVVEVRLTPRGRALYAEILPLAIEEYRAAAQGFSPREIESLKAAMRRMQSNVGLDRSGAR
jgi:DNA-binding MarR family transcriptional regulator